MLELYIRICKFNWIIIFHKRIKASQINNQPHHTHTFIKRWKKKSRIIWILIRKFEYNKIVYTQRALYIYVVALAHWMNGMNLNRKRLSHLSICLRIRTEFLFKHITRCMVISLLLYTYNNIILDANKIHIYRVFPYRIEMYYQFNFFKLKLIEK